MVKSNMMNKKAISKQVFTFLMVAILIGLLFVFGLQMLSGLNTDKCEADKVIFQKEFIELVQNSNTYGSMREESLFLPCDYDTLCLVDSEKLLNDDALDIGESGHVIMDQSIQQKSKYNVFLIKGHEVLPVGFSNKLKINTAEGFFCKQPTGRTINLIYTGTGKQTLVTDN
jgi:hypothetical protein